MLPGAKLSWGKKVTGRRQNNMKAKGKMLHVMMMILVAYWKLQNKVTLIWPRQGKEGELFKSSLSMQVRPSMT